MLGRCLEMKAVQGRNAWVLVVSVRLGQDRTAAFHSHVNRLRSAVVGSGRDWKPTRTNGATGGQTQLWQDGESSPHFVGKISI